MFANALLLIGACHISTSLAAIAFNNPPTSAEVGKSTKLTWSGSDSAEPVILTLYKGKSLDLEGGTNLTTDATGNQYIWNPSSKLANGEDYAIRIKQGSEINYTGLITLTGGSESSSSTSSSASVSKTSATATSSSAKSTSAAVIGGSHKSLSSNSTAPVTSSKSRTSATAVGSAASAGTGSSIVRNKTMSKAHLSTTSSSTASFTTGSASTASSTAGSSSPAPSSKSGGIEVASNFVLLLAGVAAVMYFG